MKRVQSIWAELSADKDRFKKVNVKLSLTDDLEDQLSMSNMALNEAANIENYVADFSSNLDSLMSEGRSLVSDIEDSIAFLESHKDDNLTIMNEYETLASDLGVDPSQSQSYRAVQAMQDILKDGIDKLQMYRGDILDSIRL